MARDAVNNSYYNTNVFFFLQNLPAFVGTLGIIILSLSLLALLILILKKLTEKNKQNKPSDRDNNKFKLLILFIFGIVFIVSFGKTHYIITELLYLIIAFIFYEITKNLKIRYMKLHILIFSWFMTFFIFHSIFVLKDVRYFVVMAPSLVYFMIMGLSEISKIIKINFRNRNITFPLIALVISFMVIFSTASQIPFILEENQDNVIFNQQIQSASLWFASYDPNYKNEKIYSDLWPNFSWFLKTNVKPVPVFKGNESFLVGVIDFSFNQTDSNQFNNYLVINNADYYFSVRNGLNLTSYTPIKKFGDLIIYKKKK
jgi:hypothetical protein